MQRSHKLGLLLISAAAFSCATGAKEFKFDFGPEESAVLDGYTRVTEKDVLTEDATHGWVVPKGVKLYSRNENFSTQTSFLKMGPGFSDHVTAGRNYHYPDKTYKFVINLERGDYAAAVVMGKMTEKYSSTINRPPFWYADYAVSANAKTVVAVDHGDLKEYLGKFSAAAEDNFFPGDSIFDKLLKRHFPVYEFSFSGDVLELEMSAVCPLNVLLVYPQNVKNELNQELANLLKTEADTINAQYKEKKPEEKALSEELKKEKILFFSSSEDEITPYTRPTPEEAFRPVGEFLPAGERGVLRFGLLPLEDLKNVQIEVSDFAGDDDATITGDAFELWLSQCTISADRDIIHYAIRPYYAFKYKPQDFKAEVARQFFLYIKVPPGTKPGDYSGRVRVSSGAIAAEQELFVKVLPFKISAPDMTLGMYAYGPKNTRLRFATMQSLGKRMYQTQRELNAEIQQKAMREMKDAGFNTVSQGPSAPFEFDENGNVVNRGDGLDYWYDFMDLYMQTFGTHPLPAYGIGWSKMVSETIIPGFWGRNVDGFKKEGLSEEAKQKAAKMTRHFYKIAKEKQWPEIIFYVQDELANHGIWGGRLGKARAEFFDKLGDEVGFRTCASMNGPVEMEEIPFLDISIPNGALPINDENVAKIRAAGSEYWIYNIGSKRFTMGYYLTKDYPKGRLQWAFYGSSRYLEQIPSLPSLGAITYSMMWDANLNPSRRADVEDMRQGIMDYRYFITLRNLVEKYADTDNEELLQAVSEGSKLMEMIRGGINTEIGKAVYGIWSPETCQRLRWKIALAIEEIENAAL